ncbi:MAG TPA: GFA family protein [Allosphingosinicella sp.]|nr:GFA family protein [Allosphingosinicella sp.]
MSDRMTGGCACGKVRYSAEIDSDDAYLCHCRMCQRATGNVSVAFKNLPKAAVRWESAPDYFESSPIARRGYCAACGTSLSFEYPDSDNMDLTLGSFDDAARFLPTHHFGAESMHRAWLDTTGLPERRSDQYQPLVDRWTKAAGKVPD